MNLKPGDAVSISLRVTDDAGEFAEASTTVTVEPADLANVVENLIAAGETQVELTATETNTEEFLQAIAALPPNPPSEVEITIVVEGTIEGQEISVPAGYTLIVDGSDGQTTIVGTSPALTVLAGNVVFQNGILFTNTTVAPTILVIGGSLTLRNTIIEETTGGDLRPSKSAAARSIWGRQPIWAAIRSTCAAPAKRSATRAAPRFRRLAIRSRSMA